MLQERIIINNERGIHARPSAEVAKAAIKFNSTITIENNGNIANAREVLQIIVLELYKGTEITLTASGDDEVEAFKTIKALLEKHYDFD